MQSIPVIQIVLSVLLIVLILMQQSEGGMGNMFGGDDAGNLRRTRRGPERAIFIATVMVAILFAVTSLLALLY
ncbi:MAG: preprotein translocase subunit SecG [Patescibacteria group bacterium]